MTNFQRMQAIVGSVGFDGAIRELLNVACAQASKAAPTSDLRPDNILPGNHSVTGASRVQLAGLILAYRGWDCGINWSDGGDTIGEGAWRRLLLSRAHDALDAIQEQTQSTLLELAGDAEGYRDDDDQEALADLMDDLQRELGR